MTRSKQEPHTDVAAFYVRNAERFDSARTRALMELPYLEQATALAPPPGRVLVIGCGAGEPLTRYFIEKGYRFTGIDAANEMLEMCRARFPYMTWRSADMRSLNLPEKFNLL